MFDHLHIEDNVKLLSLRDQDFGARDAIFQRQILIFRMRLRSPDVLLGCIRARDFESQPRHRFGQQAAAAADVQQGETAKGTQRARIPAEILGCNGANEAETHGVELMQRAEFAMRVPPLCRKPREAVDLVLVHRRR